MKKAILAVSFGTSVPETRQKTIEAIENDLAGAFPDRVFYRAWTSRFIIRKIERTAGEHIDSVQEALGRMAADGIGDVLIQPTHFTPGTEYEQMLDDIRAYSECFFKVRTGAPLLSSREDETAVLRALLRIFPNIREPDALVLMGHGSRHPSSRVYGRMNALFRENHLPNWFMGTVEAKPDLADIETWLASRKSGTEHVILSPFMVVAGDHALNDMAGDSPESWKNVLQAKGYSVKCILRGMGEYPEIRELYVGHAKAAEPLSF